MLYSISFSPGRAAAPMSVEEGMSECDHGVWDSDADECVLCRVRAAAYEDAAKLAEAHGGLARSNDAITDQMAAYHNGTCDNIAAAIRARAQEKFHGK